MPSKDYIVKIVTNEWDTWANTAENVQNTLTTAIGYNGELMIDSVTEFDRESYTLTRTGVIPDIKSVRNLIGCTLVEAKTIVDAAAKRTGTTTMFGVAVNYDPDFEPNAYHVSRATG